MKYRRSSALSRAEGCWTFDARDRMPRPSRATAHYLVKIVPAPMRAPLPRARVRSSAHSRHRGGARRGRFTAPLRTLLAADGPAAYAPKLPCTACQVGCVASAADVELGCNFDNMRKTHSHEEVAR